MRKIRAESPPDLTIAGGRVVSIAWQAKSIVEHREEIADALVATVDFGDLAVLIVLGWYAIPLVRLVYRVYFRGQKVDSSTGDPTELLPFASSVTFSVARLVSQVARVTCLVYFVDCVWIVFDIANPDISFRELEVSTKCTQLIYATWAAFRLMHFKQYLLSVAAQKDGNKLGKLGVYDRILDILILFCLAVSVLDILNIDVGPGLQSLFAFGGVGTVVLSLACKDLVAQLVCGVVVSTSENFYVGDDIKLGGDTCGIVAKIGWFYTDIRGYDEKITRIPNEQLANRRICNLTRVKRCQIIQKLHFRHSDLEKVTPVCKSILETIEREVPELITKGRPFRATLREITRDHLLVVVDTHYELPCTGNRYWNNRDKVLQIICRVLKENDVVLAMPRYTIIQEGESPKIEATAKSTDTKNRWFE